MRYKKIWSIINNNYTQKAMFYAQNVLNLISSKYNVSYEFTYNSIIIYIIYIIIYIVCQFAVQKLLYAIN